MCFRKESSQPRLGPQASNTGEAEDERSKRDARPSQISWRKSATAGSTAKTIGPQWRLHSSVGGADDFCGRHDLNQSCVVGGPGWRVTRLVVSQARERIDEQRNNHTLTTRSEAVCMAPLRPESSRTTSLPSIALSIDRVIFFCRCFLPLRGLNLLHPAMTSSAVHRSPLGSRHLPATRSNAAHQPRSRANRATTYLPILVAVEPSPNCQLLSRRWARGGWLFS